MTSFNKQDKKYIKTFSVYKVETWPALYPAYNKTLAVGEDEFHFPRGIKVI